jgi:hypothetical protein
MAFGLMTMKFLFLNFPLMIKYNNILRALSTVARLHNYIIKSNPSTIEDVPIVDYNNPQLGYLPTNIKIRLQDNEEFRFYKTSSLKRYTCRVYSVQRRYDELCKVKKIKCNKTKRKYLCNDTKFIYIYI